MNEQNKPQGQGFWKEHFELWKESGLTQQAYCLHAQRSPHILMKKRVPTY